MGILTCLLALAAAPEPVRLVAPAFSVSGVDSQTARVWSDFLVQELARLGLRIQTEGDIASVLGAERQRQLLGCVDESSCVAELAGALGADGLLLGSVAKAEQMRVVNLRVVSKAGEPLASASATGAGDKEVIAALKGLARELVEQLRGKFERGRIPDERFRLFKGHSLWPGLGAGLLGLLGTTMVSSATSLESNIRSGATPYSSVSELERTISTGRSLETGGWFVLGVAAALAVTAILIVVIGEGR